jgi:hypothetical protein
MSAVRAQLCVINAVTDLSPPCGGLRLRRAADRTRRHVPDRRRRSRRNSGAGMVATTAARSMPSATKKARGAAQSSLFAVRQRIKSVSHVSMAMTRCARKRAARRRNSGSRRLITKAAPARRHRRKRYRSARLRNDEGPLDLRHALPCAQKRRCRRRDLSQRQVLVMVSARIHSSVVLEGEIFLAHYGYHALQAA